MRDGWMDRQINNSSLSLSLSVFNGFLDNTNRTILVKEGEAVAMFCNVSLAAPSPNISWYKNDSLIDTSTPANKYNLLDDGQYLVIYNLDTSDITNNGDPIKYKCGVTNVRLFETVMSDGGFTLLNNSNSKYIISVYIHIL